MFQIVLIEDDPDESHFICRAARQHPVQCHFIELATAKEARDFLATSEAMQVDLILMDMKMGRQSGSELAREIKSMPLLKSIPIVALSHSSAPDDQVEAWESGCDGYFCKPDTAEGYAFVLKSIMEYWFSPQNMSRKHLMRRKIEAASQKSSTTGEQELA